MAVKYSKIWHKLRRSCIWPKLARSPNGTVTVTVYGHRKTINTVDGGEPYARDEDEVLQMSHLILIQT